MICPYRHRACTGTPVVSHGNATTDPFVIHSLGINLRDSPYGTGVMSQQFCQQGMPTLTILISPS